MLRNQTTKYLNAKPQNFTSTSVCLSLPSVPVCVGARLRTKLHFQHRRVLPRQVQTGHAEPGPGPVVFLGGHSRVSQPHTGIKGGSRRLQHFHCAFLHDAVYVLHDTGRKQVHDCVITATCYRTRTFLKWDEEVGASRKQRDELIPWIHTVQPIHTPMWPAAHSGLSRGWATTNGAWRRRADV